jgi:multidrug efflux pump subunit AcrA (membrane-fusion protein)
MKKKTVIEFCFLLFACSCTHTQHTHPQRKNIVDAVFASGYIINENEYVVTAATDAYLNQSLVKEGDSVRGGAPLFMLSNEVQSAQFETAKANYDDAKSRCNSDSPQIRQLQIQTEQAELQLKNDEENLNRYSNLLKTGAVSQVDFEKIKLQYETSEHNVEILKKSLSDLIRSLNLNEKNTAELLNIQQRNQKDYFITAKFDGIVMSVFKNQGEYVRRGEAVANIGNGNPIAKLFVAEEDINRINLHDKVVISLNTDKQKTYSAEISKIYPSFDIKEQSFTVEAKFQNPSKNILYNTQIQANIIVAEKKNALTVPSKFFISVDTLQLSNGKKIFVKKGIFNNEWTEILGGISENETIVLPKNKKQ